MKNWSAKAGCRGRTLVSLLVLALAAVPAVGAAQSQAAPAESAPKESNKSQPAKSGAKKEKLPHFADLTRVSTSDAARQAAADKANKKDGKSKSATKDSGSVLEFQPVPAGAAQPSSPAVVDNQKSKGVLKSIHGSVYGVGSPNGKEMGGDVGATSKGGKVGVYIETKHVDPNQPAP